MQHFMRGKIMDDLLSEFLTETAESLEIVDSELVRFEREPGNRDILSRIFRLVHTIKGTCGFIGLPRLEKVAHHAETVLGKYRDGVIPVTQDGVTVILKSIDCIKGILASLAQTQTEPAGDDSALLAALDEAAKGEAPVAAAPAPAPAPVEAPAAELGRPLKPGEVTLDELEAAFRSAPGPQEQKAEVAAPSHAHALAQPEAPETAKTETIAAPTLRVSVDVLEDLMNMVSELVLTRNQLMDIVRRSEDSEFKVPLQRLSSVTAELQEAVMKTRMQPIGNAWGKLPRVVRDLSTELGKKIELVMTGAETELDRQVLELIKDPLTHMVRNSADHGLERPADRRAAGKPETGTIRVSAHHEGGHIVIAIEDDGRGLDAAKIRAKIAERGLASDDELKRMSDAQIYRFIFHAGFSTAEKVTNVSGRGVGMDVVRTNIEQIGGAIELSSTQGQGTRFTIKIPLTLAILPALIVGTAGQRFALPQTAVAELVRVSAESGSKIEMIHGSPLLRLRDELLPLVMLNEVLGISGASRDLTQTFIVVVDLGSQRFGLAVDAVFDTEEIVVKPLAAMLRQLPLYSGTTILGDGSVIMILDAASIGQSAGRGETDNAAKATNDNNAASGHGEAGKESLLLVRAGDVKLMAIPLALVTRLEDVDAARIESSAGRPVVQYRGRLMPLLPIAAGQTLRTEGKQPVAVFTDGERSAGLAVDEIVDIVDERLVIEMRSGIPGIAGSAIINGVSTEIADVSHFLVQAYADWFERKAPPGAERNLLVVDDSAFFRNMIAPLLAAAGYRVTPASGPEQALRLKEQGVKFDAIISDIEMPGMDGISFAMAVRNDAQWGGTPLFALSSRNQPADVERGLMAGFNAYFAKADHRGLIACIDETLAPKGVAA